MQKTTIIISELSKPELLQVSTTIKQYLEEYQIQNNLKSSQLVENWSELPTLSRIVIIFTEEHHATEIFTHLSKVLLPNYKVHLTESLLRRHRSFNSLEAPAHHEPVDTNLYQEPKPVLNNEVKLETNQPPRTLFKPDLTLDTVTSNNLQEPNSPGRNKSPQSPTITLEECTTTKSN